MCSYLAPDSSESWETKKKDGVLTVSAAARQGEHDSPVTSLDPCLKQNVKWMVAHHNRKKPTLA